MLIATSKLLPYCGDSVCNISRHKLVQHAVQICNSILRAQLSGTDLDGSFDPNGRTTPAATKLEGLLSALKFLPNGQLRDRTTAATKRGIAFLLRSQIKFGPFEGGIPGALMHAAKGANEIRIDYLQHALGAWVRYRDSAIMTY